MNTQELPSHAQIRAALNEIKVPIGENEGFEMAAAIVGVAGVRILHKPPETSRLTNVYQRKPTITDAHPCLIDRFLSWSRTSNPEVCGKLNVLLNSHDTALALDADDMIIITPALVELIADTIWAATPRPVQSACPALARFCR